MRETKIRIGDLTKDDRLRFRDRFHGIHGLAQTYGEAMQEAEGWGDFPPLTCIELTEPFKWEEPQPTKDGWKTQMVKREYPAGTLLLVGGFTRVEGAEWSMCVEEAPARIHIGTWAQALLLAWSENSHHGRARSTEEVCMVLESIHADPANSKKSEREIAALANTSRGTVQRWRRKRKELQGQSEQAERAEATARGIDPDHPVDEPTVVDHTPPPVEKDARPVPASIPRDEWNRPIPAGLSPVFEGRGAWLRELKALRGAAMALLARKHGPDGLSACNDVGLTNVDVRGAIAAICTGIDLIDHHLPFIVCPHCDGRNGCAKCHKIGALNRLQADSLSPDAERKARSFGGN